MVTTDDYARQRQRRYAEKFDSYTVIVKTDSGVDQRVDDGPLSVVPTASRNRYAFMLDAYRMAAARCQCGSVDVITVQDPFAVGLVGWALKRRFDVPLHVQIHTDFLGNEGWRTESMDHRIYQRLGEFVLPRADAVRAGTEYEAAKIRKLVPDNVAVSVAPVSMPLDELTGAVSASERRSVRCSLGAGIRPIVLFVGRLVSQKDLTRWLNIAARVRDAADTEPLFLIVGDGPKRERLERKVREFSFTDDLVFSGRVSFAELRKYYQSSDIFFITSKHEGTSRVVVEALSCGLPVVATPFAGAIENVSEGNTGFVSDDDDVLVQQLARLTDDESERERMGERGRMSVAERFKSKDLVESYVQFLTP